MLFSSPAAASHFLAPAMHRSDTPLGLSSDAAFAAALIDPDLPVPHGVVGPHGKKADRRFAVYRNTVTVSLVTALGDIFPVVRKLVGEGFFRAMAQIHVAASPPSSPLLFDYGRDFPAFLEGFEPVARLVYLPDVARLERAWLDSFHAADADPLDPEDLGRVAPDRLADLTFTPHPAMQIVASRYAIVSIVAASRADQSLSSIEPLEPEAGLITRPDSSVILRHLPEGGAFFLSALAGGAVLGEAAGQTLADWPMFDLPSAIAAMLEAGAFTACANSSS